MLTRSRTSVSPHGGGEHDWARSAARRHTASPTAVASTSVSSTEGGAGTVVRYRENAYPPSRPPSATASASASSLEGSAMAIR